MHNSRIASLFRDYYAELYDLEASLSPAAKASKHIFVTTWPQSDSHL